jgi:phosphoglycolate phosphatase
VTRSERSEPRSHDADTPAGVMTPYDVVLLDLDGTIVDSAPGIQSALRHAITTGFGIVPTQADLEEFMGPPLADVLPRVFGLTDPADEQRFFELYCEVYFHGAEYEFDVYPGMTELIGDLSAAGIRLALATAKPDESATRVLEHADLLQYFTFVGGSHVDGSRQDKVDVLAHTLEQINAESSLHRIVLVGDRALDERAARAHGADSILVRWGYATPGELDEAGATHVVSRVDELRTLLLPEPAGLISPSPVGG